MSLCYPSSDLLFHVESKVLKTSLLCLVFGILDNNSSVSNRSRLPRRRSGPTKYHCRPEWKTRFRCRRKVVLP